MNIISIAAALVASAGLSATAAGAATTVSGAYLVQYTSNCQAIFDEVSSGKVPIASVSQGHIEEEIGTVTFTPATAGATSGKVALSLQTVAGDSVVRQHNGVGPTGVSAAPVTASGAYSLGGNLITLVLGPTSQASFQIELGAPKAGVAQSAVILKQPVSGDTCIESAVLLHQ